MRRALWTTALAAWLTLAGCTADPVPMTDDGGGGAGGDLGRVDYAFDMHPTDMGEPGDGPIEDDVGALDMGDLDRGAGGAGGEGGAVDMTVDMEPDMEADEGAGGGPAVDPPAFGVVAVTRRGQDTVFAWVDAEGQLAQLFVDRTGRAGEVEVVATPIPVPTRVVATEAEGHPWVAYGAPGAPIVLYQPDFPRVTRIEFDDLYGEPLLSPAADGVLVFGQTEDGTVAWRRVSNELEAEPRIADTLGIEAPTDAGEVPVGVVLMLGGEEQCIEISKDGWHATTSFVCSGDQPRIVSDGRHALLSVVYKFGPAQRIGVRRLYGKTEVIQITGFGINIGLQFPMDGPRRPVIGVNNQAQTLVSVIGPYETWDSVDRWEDLGSSPLGRVRAMAQRALPGRSGEATQWIVALDFRSDGRPRVRVLPLARRGQHDNDADPNCVARAEVCNLADEDCDTLLNNGLCCNGVRPTVSYRWSVAGNQPVAQVEDPDGTLRYEFLVADVENADAYRAVYRIAGTSRWEGKTFLLQQAGEAGPRELGVTFEGAVEGRMLLGAGGTHTLIARRAPAEGSDQPGGYAVFFKNQSDNDPANPRLKSTIDLDCTEVLAADVLDHSLPMNGAGGEQIVVVCPDKIMRLHANLGIQNAIYPVETLSLPRLGWATMLRNREDQLWILVGYEFGGGEGWNVARFEISSGGRPVPFGQPGGVLNLLSGFSAMNPIYLQPLHPLDSRPPVQIVDDRYVRLPIRRTDDDGVESIEWREARLAPMPTRTEHVRRFDGHQLFSAGPYVNEMGATVTGWWAIEVDDVTQPYNLWAPEPAFTISDPVAHWAVSRGPYDARQQAAVYDHQVVIITSTDGGTGRNWLLRTRQAACASP
ncbi:MAG: hypothetical protein H6701_17285 [Myxococcales bacterium]|nr:hypothetical protein [Myxococcales bacterium]